MCFVQVGAVPVVGSEEFTQAWLEERARAERVKRQRQTEAARARLEQVAEEAAERVRGRILQRLKAGLPSSPEELMTWEQETHRIAAQEMDIIVGAVVQEAHDSDAVREKAEELLRQHPHMRLQEKRQTVVVALLGGSTVSVVTPYYLERPPKKAGRPRGRGRRGKPGNGMYPALAVLGIHFRVTPAVSSEVARLTVMVNSQAAVETLELRGIKMDRKKILRLTRQLGRRGLDYRAWLQEQAAQGKRGRGSVAGKRLVIGTDGGRVRLRYRKAGRPRKNGRCGFKAEWKEPKVIVIYEIDDKGRKTQRGLVRYDATLQKADGTFAILVAQLMEIGAHEAAEWIFTGDGAVWIWNRIEDLVKAVGFQMTKVTQIVDWYHALEHFNKVKDLLPGMPKKQLKAWMRRMKNLLFKGDIDALVAEITTCAKGRNAKKIKKLLHYFTTNIDRMQYKTFKARRLPLGSGAVESCVRRVINLRMKSNGIFWDPSNAEDILHLRAQFVAGRWHSYVATILQPREFWAQGVATPKLSPPATADEVRKAA
jgi:hypothetical protein